MTTTNDRGRNRHAQDKTSQFFSERCKRSRAFGAEAVFVVDTAAQHVDQHPDRPKHRDNDHPPRPMSWRRCVESASALQRKASANRAAPISPNQEPARSPKAAHTSAAIMIRVSHSLRVMRPRLKKKAGARVVKSIFIFCLFPGQLSLQ